MDIMWRRNRKFITVALWRRTLGEGRGEMGWIILCLVLLLAQGISSSLRCQAILGLHFEVLGVCCDSNVEEGIQNNFRL